MEEDPFVHNACALLDNFESIMRMVLEAGRASPSALRTLLDPVYYAARAEMAQMEKSEDSYGKIQRHGTGTTAFAEHAHLDPHVRLDPHVCATHAHVLHALVL